MIGGKYKKMSENTQLTLENQSQEKRQDLVPQNDMDLPQLTTGGGFEDYVNSFKKLYNLAKVLSQSTIIPQTYQSKPDNVFIALEMAARMNVSPTFVMNNLYIVQGRPSWSGQACVAMIKGCGLYDNIEYVYVGEENSDEWGCYVQAFDKKLGKTIQGSTVTIKQAKDEGWYGKTGSKWKTLPHLMLTYRAAAFFARVHCPNILQGFLIADETTDIAKPEPEKIKISLD